MEIELFDFGFIEYLDNPLIDKIVFTYNQKCTVFFHNKSVKNLNIPCSAYNRQYGIPVSDDGMKLFVSDWEKGLSAYNTASGELIWKYKASKIRNILIYPNFILVSRANSGIYKIDIETGKVYLGMFSGTLEHIFNLMYPYIFADSLSGKCGVINIEKMNVVKTYSSKIVNPDRCLSFSITDVRLHNNKIYVIGMENFSQGRYDFKCMSDQIPFYREIEHDFHAIGKVKSL